MKQLTTASIILLLLLSLTVFAHAELTPARICIGTREAIVSPQAVFDGNKVYSPLGLLDSLGVTYSSEKPGEITITNALGRSGVLETTLVNGTTMVHVDKMAEVIGLGYTWNPDKRTVLLTARLESVEFTDNTLKINSTIPVSYKVTSWDSAAKLMVDVSCTRLATPANEVFVGTALVDRVRLGQPDETTARVVLDLKKSVSYRVGSGPLSAKIEVVVSERVGGPAVANGSRPAAAKPYEVSAIKVEPIDDYRFQVIISTSSKGSCSPVFSSRPAKVTLSLANCTLADTAESYSGGHALLSGVRITQNPATRKAAIELSLKRAMVYDTRVDGDSITVMVTPPAKSGGKLADKLIMVDPGHGNLKYGKIDPGAQYGGVTEKDINLAIAKEVAACLQEQGARVIMTRTGDNGLSVAGRPEMARKSGADIFISIHCNALGILNKATGVETYFHKFELSPMLLAQAIQESVCDSTGMCDLKARSDTKLYDDGLGVLRGLSGSGIPGVLLECGYLDHSADRSKLSDPDFRKKIARAITAGLKKYVEGD